MNRSSSAVAATAAVVALLGVAVPASATPRPVQPVIELKYDGTEQRIRVFGAASVETGRIPIGTGVRTITALVDYDLYDFTDCRVTDDAGMRVVEATSLESTAPRTLVFDVPDGALRDGEPYRLDCTTGPYAEVGNSWNLTASSALPGTIATITAESSLLSRLVVRQDLFDWEGRRVPVESGERLRFTGYAGVWSPPGSRSPLEFAYRGPRGELSPVTVTDAEVSPDGASLTFTVPELPPGTNGGSINASVSGLVPATPTGPEAEARTVFSALVTTVDKAATTTSLSLSSRLAVLTTPRATVRVATSDGAVTTGEVVVYGDGYVISRTRIENSRSAVIRLPRLSRGIHEIRAVFQSSDTHTGSVSLPQTLLQVR